MTLSNLVDQIEMAGGVLKLESDDRIRIKLPHEMRPFSAILREQKAELLEILRRLGGRIAAFPHCPACASYALYRKDNTGDYECLSCGCRGIEEHVARRLQ
jgi:Zn ribbon nucleic-acid-binding protein